jgi:chromate transporter
LKKFFESIFYFLKLGALGFGGPFALVMQMQSDLVEKRKWLSALEFQQALVAIKTMPGPLAAQMCIYLSRKYAGWWAGLFSGLAFLVPSFLLMIALASGYALWTDQEWLRAFLNGLQMAALAYVFFSLKALVGGFGRNRRFWIFVAISLALFIAKVPEGLVIPILGLWSWATKRPGVAGLKLNSLALFSIPILMEIPDFIQLGLVCVKAGALVFGTGLSIIPLLQFDIVDIHNWMSLEQFKDAVAFGLMTPGPVLITVTFIGYKIGGLSAALWATFWVFFPSYFHQLTWFPRALAKFTRASWAADFLLGATGGVVGGLLKSGFLMTQNLTADQALIFSAALLGFVFLRLPSVLLIFICGLVSLAVSFV